VQIFSLSKAKLFPFRLAWKENHWHVCLNAWLFFHIFYAVWLMRQRQKVLQANNFGLACRTKPKDKHRPDELSRPPFFLSFGFLFYLFLKEVVKISLILFLACNVLVSLLIAHTWPGVFWRYWWAIECMSCFHNEKACMRSCTGRNSETNWKLCLNFKTHIRNEVNFIKYLKVMANFTWIFKCSFIQSPKCKLYLFIYLFGCILALHVLETFEIRNII